MIKDSGQNVSRFFMRWVPFLWIVPLFLFLTLSYDLSDITYDDAFISFRYSRMLSQGYGMVWNPGERVEGYSNFLWVVVLAGIHKMGGDIVMGSKILGIVCNLTTLTLLALLIRKTMNDLWGWIGVLILSFFPAFVIWGVVGLETSVYSMLVMSLVFFGIEKNVSAVSFCALFLAMARPEGAFLGGIVYIILFVALPEQHKKFYRWGGIALGLYLVYTLWRYVYFGFWLPNTFYAKATGGEAQIWMGLRYTRDALKNHWTCMPAILLLIYDMIALRKRPSLIFLLPIGLIVAQGFFIIIVGGDWMWDKRFIHPILALLVLLFINGLGTIWHNPRQRYLWRIVAGIFLFAAIWQHTPNMDNMRLYLKFYKHPLTLSMESTFVPMAKKMSAFLEEIAPKNARIALNHVGVIAYYTNLNVLDMNGLSDVHIAHLSGNRPLHEKFDADYVLSRKPEFIVLNTNTPPSGGRMIANYWIGERAVMNHPDFRKHYAPLAPIWKWGGALGTSYAVLFCRNDIRPPGTPLP